VYIGYSLQVEGYGLSLFVEFLLFFPHEAWYKTG
jgi:hypothetical protein